MNIYKFYFSHLIKAVENFKSDFKYSFIVEDILKKLTLEPPKNSINGDMSTNLAMILSKDLKLSPKIIAENFTYNKFTNILDVFGNVKLISNEDDIVIFSVKPFFSSVGKPTSTS